MKERKKDKFEEIPVQRSPHLIRYKGGMMKEEIEKFQNMNWEWYYNCYLYLDEPIMVTCKICGGMTLFLPREMKKKCENCGIECHRCEVDESKK
ncbi:MAG TPA: hypothetical protein PLI53_02135 [Geobacteraceae bacterium]|nr:hypothetical protein [Geobacteraceae bacterium]